jgi:hypothetical protein
MGIKSILVILTRAMLYNFSLLLPLFKNGPLGLQNFLNFFMYFLPAQGDIVGIKKIKKLCEPQRLMPF